MKTIFVVRIDGQDISATLLPILISLSVSDSAGQSSDTASLELDDTDGRIILPQPGARVTILLGWEGKGVGIVFEGTVDEVSAKGGRGGRTIFVSAKGMDTRGKAKQKQRRHFDKTKIGDALKKAGETAGVTVKVDKELADIERDYIALDDESFVAFGQRLGREVGGTFKIVGKQAILAKRNGGKSVDGKDLPTVTAAWGLNLHDYDVKPLLGRPVEKKTRARWYDRKAAKWKHEEADTGTEGGETIDVSPFAEADETSAKHRSSADAAKRDRASGEGTVTIEGDITAQPEGTCLLVGCRPGVDGTYRIESVDHEYSRAGWTTRLQLRQPKGSAGKDKRGSNSGSGRWQLS